MSHSQNCTICGLLQTLQCSDDPKLWIILWICSHACPCSRHEHWHTGDALVHFVGLLVSGCLTIGRRSFSWLRKVPGPVCVPSNPFSVQCFKKKNVFPVIGKSIKKLQVDGEGCLISLCFLLVLCVLWGDRSLCERGLCFVGFVGFFLPLRRACSGSLVPFNLWPCDFSILQEAIIGGLHSETTYSVTVAAYTTKGDGARSKAKVITTTGAGQSRFHLGYHVKHRICTICVMCHVSFSGRLHVCCNA